MFDLCSWNPKKTLPILVALLLVAQLDLASAFGWPLGLLSLVHLTAQTNDSVRGICSGLGCSIDVLVAFQLLRIFARRTVAASRDLAQD
jgi:ABC-type antimicrobial peptide transport system permease subunit